MKDYTLKYGKGSVTFAIDEAHVTELYGTPVPKIDDIRAALLAAADIADKDILLIPNGSTVVPYPKA